MFKILALSIVSVIYADYLGGYSGSGQRYTTNAREMSLGNSITSEYNQGFNAFSNPALLYKSQDLEIGSSYFMMSLDRSVQAFSVTRKLPPSAGASLSFFRSGVDNIIGKGFVNEGTGKFDSSESYLMLSFGASIANSLSLGFNLKSIFNSIDDYDAQGLSGDFGLIFNLSDELILSWVANNFFGKYNWSSITSSSGEFEESLQMINSFGVMVGVFDNMKFFSKLSYMNPEKNNLYRIQAGAEFDRDRYVLRFGAMQNRGIKNDDSFNFKILLGAGTYINVFKDYKIKLDYCIDLGKEEEGISNLFSLSFIR